MNVYIRKALVMLLSEEIVVSSWGITNISVSADYCKFHVDGFCYIGFVEITYQEGLYKVLFEDGRVIESTLEKLVIVLDANIEKASSYDRWLTEWLTQRLR